MSFLCLVYKTHTVFERDQILFRGEGGPVSLGDQEQVLSLCSFPPARDDEDHLGNALKPIKKLSRLAFISREGSDHLQ